jgi:DNA polymerase/3'-5' exonuclease PolX
MTDKLTDAEGRAKYPDYITTTHGGSGYFAIQMRWYADMQGYDVQQTGIGRYSASENAAEEGRIWAEAENLQHRP